MTSLSDWKSIFDAENVAFPETNFKLNSIASLYDAMSTEKKFIGDDFKLSDIEIDDSGFFKKNDSPVLAYIRRGRGEVDNRKYHFTYCKTIQQLPAATFYCTNDYKAGFLVDIEESNGDLLRSKSIDMTACVYCVGDYFELTGNDNFDKRNELSKIISPEYILASAGRLFKNSIWKSKIYKHWDKAWSQISKEVRERANWCCDSCERDFSQGREKWLHVHHINSDRNDNHINNLRPLCLGCHAEQAGHGKLKDGKSYGVFLKIYPDFKPINN